MTKQEIQEYRGVISMLIDVRLGDKMLEKVLSVSLKALDIAEKQVWRTDTPPYQEMVLFIFRYSLNGQGYYDFRNGMVSDDGSDDIVSELGDPLDGYSLQDIVWWIPLPTPPHV